MKNVMKQALVAGGVVAGAAFVSASDANAHTTCGCQGQTQTIDESRTFQEAFKDAPGAAAKKGIRNQWCHIMGKGRDSGTNYMNYFDGEKFTGEWQRFRLKSCPGVSTGEKTPVIKETKGKTTGSFTETSKGEVKTSTKYVVDLNELPKACRAEVIDHGRKLKP